MLYSLDTENVFKKYDMTTIGRGSSICNINVIRDMIRAVWQVVTNVWEERPVSIFHPENGSNTFLLDVRNILPDYTGMYISEGSYLCENRRSHQQFSQFYSLLNILVMKITGTRKCRI
jgi:hypothetical protein